MHFSGNPVETEGTDANFRRIADFISLALLSKTLYEKYRVHTSSGCVSLASPICASSPAMDFHGSCISSVDRGSSLKEIKTLLGKLGIARFEFQPNFMAIFLHTSELPSSFPLYTRPSFHRRQLNDFGSLEKESIRCWRYVSPIVVVFVPLSGNIMRPEPYLGQ